MSDIEYIASKLSREELLCQLAEEAAELAQAALKLRRAITGTNPTPVDCYGACGKLLEEIADVRVAEQVYISTATKDGDMLARSLACIMENKTTRWAGRLRNAANTNREPVTPTVAPTDTPTGIAWISVEDRLPEDARERVLVKLGKSNHDIGDPKVDTDRYTVGCTGELCWARWGKLVTHWMPLPESAKEDANE